MESEKGQIIDKMIEFCNKVGAPYTIIIILLYLAHSTARDVIVMLQTALSQQEMIIKMIGAIQR